MRKIGRFEGFPRLSSNNPAHLFANGFFPIKQVKKDALFHGLSENMIMKCSHYCEVKKLPPDFEILATSEHCKIEAMRHTNRPLYGTQFHPEAYEPPFSYGQKILKNFAEIVDCFWCEEDLDVQETIRP